ncbi:MAG: undecaprenyldiphospho-muramoylpentapeptide beta-N-acetylglucosaminyltransferase [Alphaproteobacteria bacterium]|nr:undecaprenyldiphospho-muramoylpentapeptide beta-N-acetylglucosaminyltransferase [Alphaproteobacteria bacterium]
MNSDLNHKTIFITGGGTGGHIFPAISIAEEFQYRFPEIKILFFGAIGKMEMEKIPAAGFNIVGLPMSGFNRKQLWKNIALPFKILKSILILKKYFKQNKPLLVIGVGGYSTFPVIALAQWLKIPNFIHESNALPGKANLKLGKRASMVFGGFAILQKYFKTNQFIYSGNPVRSNILNSASIDNTQAKLYFNLNPSRKVILIFGGSLGALSINKTLGNQVPSLLDAKLNIIWQYGAGNESFAKQFENKFPGQLWSQSFITNMEMAYAAADIIVCRSGAMSLAELIIIGKPAILIPYPYATDNHQKINAMSLVEQNVALLLEDKLIEQDLVSNIIELAQDDSKYQFMKDSFLKLEKKMAVKIIVDNILNFLHDN